MIIIKWKSSDPFAFLCEVPPETASITRQLEYTWYDDDWMSRRRQCNSISEPISIYEVHLGSWRRVLEEGNRSLNYREE